MLRADSLMYIAKNRKNIVIIENDEDATKEELDEIKQQVLIVDDAILNRELLSEMLGNDFRILEASNGAECIEKLKEYGAGISIVLLDMVMPVMDGYEVLDYMNKNHWIDDIPVIVISGEDSESYVRKAYEMGVSDYISRPFDVKVVYQRVINTIKLYAKQRRLIRMVTDQIYRRENNNKILISILSHIVEFRNGESGSHVIHINKLTDMLLKELVGITDRYDITGDDIELIATASAIHDIGKIGIDDAILNKPGRLTDEEFEVMKTHTVIGARMLDDLDAYKGEKLLETAWQICRWHHERYDGNGYPDGLKGDDIPISAQVVSVADVYDALTSNRVYKRAFSHEKAMQKALMMYRKPENYDLVKEALIKAGRQDLIGFDKKCLIAPRKMDRKGEHQGQRSYGKNDKSKNNSINNGKNSKNNKVVPQKNTKSSGQKNAKNGKNRNKRK